MSVVALFDITLNADSVATAPPIMRETLKATRAFPGCQSIEVVVDAADETHFVVIEHWDSADSDAAYRAFRASPAGASDLGALLAKPPTRIVYTVADDI